MHTDLDTLATALYVKIDDELKARPEITCDGLTVFSAVSVARRTLMVRRAVMRFCQVQLCPW